jgi:hypothetical protein
MLGNHRSLEKTTTLRLTTFHNVLIILSCQTYVYMIHCTGEKFISTQLYTLDNEIFLNQLFIFTSYEGYDYILCIFFWKTGKTVILTM